MENNKKSAIIGFHEKSLLDMFSMYSEEFGYKVDLANNFEEMLQKCKENDYNIYLMDLNLGKKGSPDINPAIIIYRMIEPKVKEGKAKFMGLSGRYDVVESAIKERIPADDKISFVDKLKSFLE